MPETYLDFNPYKLPKKLLAAIGLAITSCAQTDNIIQEAIAGCMGTDFDYGLSVTTHMANPIRDHALRSVAEIRIDDCDALDLLDEILDRIVLAWTKRNSIAHDSWATDKDGNIYLVSARSRGSLKMESVPKTVAEVEEDAKFIYSVGMELEAFLTLHNLHSRFPNPPRSRAHKSKAERRKRRGSGLSGK